MISGIIEWLVIVILVSLAYWVIAQFAPPVIVKITMVVCVVVVVFALIFIILPLASVHLFR